MFAKHLREFSGYRYYGHISGDMSTCLLQEEKREAYALSLRDTIEVPVSFSHINESINNDLNYQDAIDYVEMDKNTKDNKKPFNQKSLPWDHPSKDPNNGIGFVLDEYVEFLEKEKEYTKETYCLVKYYIVKDFSRESWEEFEKIYLEEKEKRKPKIIEKPLIENKWIDWKTGKAKFDNSKDFSDKEVFGGNNK